MLLLPDTDLIPKDSTKHLQTLIGRGDHKDEREEETGAPCGDHFTTQETNKTLNVIGQSEYSSKSASKWTCTS